MRREAHVPASGYALPAMGADQIPEDVRAERDAEERLAGAEPSPPGSPLSVPEDVRAEQDSEE